MEYYGLVHLKWIFFLVSEQKKFWSSFWHRWIIYDSPPRNRTYKRKVVGLLGVTAFHRVFVQTSLSSQSENMYLSLFLIGLLVNFVRSFPQNLQKQQQYGPHLPYDIPLLEPQYQVPNYNFIPDNKHYPQQYPGNPGGVPPQILYYGAAGGGQPFLLQPGTNFLVPQPGPNVILRDSPPPQRPVFLGGYPKPAHIPPIEKDAEEVPTNPSQIPPFNARDNNKGKDERKPQKLETFNEDDEPAFPKKNTPEIADKPLGLQPGGQRFFILNGQHLFSNYPFNQYPNPHIHHHGVKYTAAQETHPQYRASPHDFDLLQYQDDENDAIVIDARGQNDEVDTPTTSSPVVETSETPQKPSERPQEEKSGEPTIAQAQPAAIALAGPGGVAAAAPRGNAFAGKEGLAVSSPQATAVAGPNKEENGEKKKTNKRRS